MCQYDNTIWYLWDMGFDAHVVHWHGNNVNLNELDAGVVPINPGQSTTVSMQPASYGWWHFLCHYNTHLDKGMEASYVVYPVNECPLPPLKLAAKH
jgi:FtsP/CotA-like multicopper oxidase with cupredoxin domain